MTQSPEQAAALRLAEENVKRENLFQQGLADHQMGHYDSARSAFSSAANLGHAMAMSNLGTMAFNGQGMPVNIAEAQGWWLRAAERGLPHANMNLGFLKISGAAGEFDPVTGAAMIRKAYASPELQSEINQRTGIVCTESRQGLNALPSKLKLIMEIMPVKAAMCGMGEGDIDDCIHSACNIESMLGEKNSCDALEVALTNNSRRRNEFISILTALGCQ